MNGLINEHLHGGIVEYVDRLLDEKIVMLKKELEQHLQDDSAHVTEEEKEKWNERDNSSSSSSDSSDDATSSTVIPSKISELENDVDYLTREDLSMYATEEEVRSWLDGYEMKSNMYSGEGSGSEGSSDDDDDEYTDEVIIDKFRVDPSKTPLTGVKSIYLHYDRQDGKLSIKPFTAQTASLSVSPASAEYGTTVNVMLTAAYKMDEMTQVTVTGGNLGTKKIIQTLTDTISGITDTVSYTLNYTPKEDEAGKDTKSILVSKKMYIWHSNGSTQDSIPSNASSSLYTGKPGSITFDAPNGQYAYIAFPNSWNVNPATFKVGGFSFGYISVKNNANGPYGLTGDYTIIRSAQTGLGKTTINT